MASGSPQLGHLEGGLLNRAQLGLLERGYSLSTGARDILTHCVIQGAQTMRLSGEPQSPEVERARASIDKLVDEISREAKAEQQRLRDQQRGRGFLDKLSEKIIYTDEQRVTILTIEGNLVSSVMAKLCPGFWPFC